MIGDTWLDRIVGRVQLTEALEILENRRTVVLGMTAVLWFGVVQILVRAASSVDWT